MPYIKLLIVYIALLWSHIAAAQSVNADSLHNIIKDRKQHDTILAKVYITLIDFYAKKDKDEAAKIIDEAQNFANYSKDSLIIADIFQAKGAAYKLLGSLDSAATFYYTAAEIFERHKNEKKAAYVYNDIARMYRRGENFERAISFYDKAMAIFKKHNDLEGQSIILNESGVAFHYKGDYDEAINRYNASLAIQKQRNDSVGIGYCFEFLGTTYLMKKDNQKGKYYLDEALKIRLALKDTFALAINYINIAEYYSNIGENENAIDYAKQTIALAKAINFTDLLRHSYQLLAELYKKSGNYKDAYENMSLYQSINDSIYNADKVKQIEELSTKYETEKNKAKIKEQEWSITKRNYWIVGIALFLIASVLIAVSYYRRMKLKQKAKLQEVIMQQQELATKAVIEAEEEERKRIARDLHDSVGQMMSAAKMYLSGMENEMHFANETQKSNFEKTRILVEDSCREVRSVSHNMMPNALLKHSLASAVREFIDKIDKRSLKVYLYTEGLDTRLDANVEIVFYRIIQECVNNVIKHAEATALNISVIKDDEGISATIEDNGKGFDTKDVNVFDGIGLKNIMTRVAFLKGTVDFDSRIGEGTLVAIFVPLS